MPDYQSIQKALACFPNMRLKRKSDILFLLLFASFMALGAKKANAGAQFDIAKSEAGKPGDNISFSASSSNNNLTTATVKVFYEGGGFTTQTISVPGGINLAPLAFAGEDIAMTWPDNQGQLSATGSNQDANPYTGRDEKGFWTNENPEVLFANPNVGKANFTIAQPGIYELIWNYTDGAATTTDALTISAAPAQHINIVNDDTYEYDENFTIELIDPDTSASLAVSTYTIENDDPKPRVSLAYDGPASAQEGELLNFRVQLQGQTDVPVTMHFNYSGDLACDGPSSDTLTASTPYSFRTAEDALYTPGIRTVYVGIGQLLHADTGTTDSLAYHVEEDDPRPEPAAVNPVIWRLYE